MLKVTVAAVALWGGPAAPDPAVVQDVMGRFDAIETERVWPGFSTSTIPLMLYDGERTWLRGVNPCPEGFTRVGDLGVYEGRHPVHRANTAADLDGAWVATFELRPDSETDESFLRLMVHESFHVHQNRALREHTMANEASRFTFPTTDGEELALRRLETEALRSALDAEDADDRRAWGARFTSLRRERQPFLSDAEAEYERAIERLEGLCEYVAWSSVSRGSRPKLPARALAPDGVRDRPYWTGAALGMLLDTLDPGWPQTMIEDPALHLDTLLARAVRGTDPAPLEDESVQRTRADAFRDASAEQDRRAAIGDAFLDAPGWRIEIESPSLLWPAGFDPLNVVCIDSDRILHTRYLQLQNDACSLEVLGSRALTTGAGDHPLFNGVARVLITGISEPDVVTAEGETTIETEGVRIEVPADAVEIAGEVIRVRLPG